MKNMNHNVLGGSRNARNERNDKKANALYFFILLLSIFSLTIFIYFAETAAYLLIFPFGTLSKSLFLIVVSRDMLCPCLLIVNDYEKPSEKRNVFIVYNCLLCSTGTTVKLTRCNDVPRTKVGDVLNPNHYVSHEGYPNGGRESEDVI